MTSIISMKMFISRNKLLVAFILLVLPVLGEFKFSPFGTDFRFAVSSIAFMMVLLLVPDLPKVITGFIVGIVMVAFRMSLDVIITDLDLLTALIRHYPAGIYYVALAFWLQIININSLLHRPIFPVVVTIIGDIGSNVIELAFRYQTIFTGDILAKIPILTIVATIRVVWIYGIINIFQLQKLKALRKQEQEQFQEMLIFISTLNCEAFFLKKTLKEMEQIMAQAYNLYQRLLAINHNEPKLNQIALSIATEVHEVKKDSQRILAGIAKLIEFEKSATKMSLKDMVLLVIKANQSYADSLGKTINFATETKINLEVTHVYPLLTIFNNLVTNAVEASHQTGQISIEISSAGENLIVNICDRGSGISRQDLELIFHPGYTTKFNHHGISSTGIGLTHVKELVKNLGGRIVAESTKQTGTCFTLTIPKGKLVEE